MAETPPFVWGIAGLAIGVFGFIFGLKSLFMKRMIENIPTSKVRSIAMGLVEVFGQVVPFKMMKSPFSGKDCVYYRYEIQEEHHDNKGRSYWATVKKAETSMPFWLKDETGSVLVDCTGAKVDIKVDSVFESGIGHDPPPQVLSFLKTNKIAHDSFIGFNKHMKYIEHFIEPGDKLYIMGTASENRAGGISGARHTDNIVIQKGENEKAFYVSDRSEKEILSSLSWTVRLGVFGGAALIIGSVAFLILSYQYAWFW
jgi:hypothetical protein